jgi:DNA processing protein
MDARQATIWTTLIRAPNTSAAPVRAALAQLGDVSGISSCSASQLNGFGFTPAAVAYLVHPPMVDIDQDLDWLTRTGATLLPMDDPRFPPQLATLKDAPPALYVRGEASLLAQPQLAVVGSRTPTATGRRFTTQITRELCSAGLVITSGLARGIDAAAHEAALNSGGCTIAVCGTGLGHCYPPEHLALFERMASGGRGAVVSEFPPDSGARPQHFPRRNRIIAGLARGTLVVEAALGSGSLITARRALDAGREVLAVPGSPLNSQAAGCLQLLTEGAHLVRHAVDVLANIQIPIESNALVNQSVAAQTPGSVSARKLDKDYEMLLDALGFEPASIDDLVDRTGLAPGSVASMMLLLELEGRVEPRPGALFNRVIEE